MKKFASTTVLMAAICLSTPAFSQDSGYQSGTGLLSKQMREWCSSGDASHQSFCTGFLLGVYENSSCLTTGESPDWDDLRKVFIGYLDSTKGSATVFATVAASEAFLETYDCQSALTMYRKRMEYKGPKMYAD